MRFVSGSLIFLSSFALLAGCSDKGSSNSVSTTSAIDGWVGAQGLNNGQVVVNQIAESGQVSVDTNGIYNGVRESTDTSSRYKATVQNNETILLIARGQIANVDKDKDNLATQRQCQVAAGCGDLDPKYKFANYYPSTSGFEWRAVIYSAGDDSRNNVNAITTLAAAFAYDVDVKYGYDNHASHDHTGFEATPSSVFFNHLFTPYDVVLANSQTSNLLGLQDIIGDLPANLTQLNKFNENTAAIRNQIRYGALLAGLQKLELAYWAGNNNAGDQEFISLVAEQFAADSGQFYNHTPDVERVLTLKDLYEAARDNLSAIAVNVANTQAKAAADAVVAKFSEELTAIETTVASTKTAQVADELAQLLTADDVIAFNLGLEKTKLFVNDLLSYQQTFWQAGYKSELDGYLALLKTIGDEHRENLDDLVTEFARVQSYYVNCIIQQPAASVCSLAYNPGDVDLEGKNGLKDIADLDQSYNATTKVLTLNSGVFTSGIAITSKVTVSQKIADLNLVDNNNSPSSSNAMDIFITGKMDKGNLVLSLAHSMSSDGLSIEIPSSMRIYYNEKVSGVPTNTDLEIQGYELIWGEFELYDKSKLGVDYNPDNVLLGSELELNGAFRIFFRGVRDPQDANSELRFNIENWVLSSRISDQVDDEAGTDTETSSLIITGSASNPDSYYPAQKLAKFDGFFTSNDAYPVGESLPNLLTYSLGTENIASGSNTIVAQTIDFINTHSDDVRYRFYPNERVVDENDSDRDGNYTETLDMHRVEECKLNDNGKVTSCRPKSKIYSKLNVQNTINDLWEIGLFQQVPVEGQGTYFIDFPTTTDANGCLILDTLTNDQGPMPGSLIEQQVLGLDTLRLLTETQIRDASGQTLPKTLLDVSIVAPTKDKYRLTAGLSHNYSSTTTDSSGIVLGTGSEISSLLVSYDTSADFENAGNISVAKGGVTLTLNDSSTVVESQDITAFLSQKYDPSTVGYTIIEDENGQPNRCVKSVGTTYEKNPADVSQVFYLNYRDVIYGTIRPEGDSGIWTIRFIDGSWIIPSSVPADVETGS